MLNAESGKTWRKLSLIKEHARQDPDLQFTSLAHLLNKEFLRDCHKSLNRNKAVGVDEVGWEDYDSKLEENLDDLVGRLKRKPNTFDFLGFTHYCDETRKGRFKVGRKTRRKKFNAKCKELNDWLKSVRNLVKTKEWWNVLRAKLRGHYQYYGVSENSLSILKFYRKALRLTHKWLNRRSQKKKMNWREFNSYLEKYPLPKPRIAHSFYENRMQRKLF